MVDRSIYKYTHFIYAVFFPDLAGREVTDMFLFDTEGAGYGGTGKKFNWDMLTQTNVGKPFLLSGGIQPEDAEKLKAFARDPVAKELFAIDINSKFEVAPGIKDMSKVKQFVRQLTVDR